MPRSNKTRTVLGQHAPAPRITPLGVALAMAALALPLGLCLAVLGVAWG